MSDQLAALFAQPSAINGLPYELARHRILTTQQTLEFLGFSSAHWRRLRNAKLAPPPVMIGTRRQGWRLGTLIDWSASREQKAQDAA